MRTQAASHHQGHLVIGHECEKIIESRGKMAYLEVFAMNHVIAGRQANRGIAMKAKFDDAAKNKTVVKVSHCCAVYPECAPRLLISVS